MADITKFSAIFFKTLGAPCVGRLVTASQSGRRPVTWALTAADVDSLARGVDEAAWLSALEGVLGRVRCRLRQQRARDALQSVHSTSLDARTAFAREEPTRLGHAAAATRFVKLTLP